MPPISIAERSPIAPIGKRTLVLCVADCHYGADWIVRGLRGEILNRYNPEVFGERMDDLLAQVREIIVKENISDVQLLLCGDSLDGMLRNSQLMKLRWGVIESCMRFSEHMAQWIAALSQYATVSVCGMDEYAQRLGYGGKPGALAMVLEAGYGRRCIYPISL